MASYSNPVSREQLQAQEATGGRKSPVLSPARRASEAYRRGLMMLEGSRRGRSKRCVSVQSLKSEDMVRIPVVTDSPNEEIIELRSIAAAKNLSELSLHSTRQY